MKTEDTHTLVQNEHTENPPVYSSESTTPAVPEGRLQPPKYYGCCEARIGWTIWYSIKCFFVILFMIKIFPLVQGYFHYYWLLYALCFMFLICFGCLMFGVHGERQNHNFFYPMIVMEWVLAGLMSLVGLFVWIGWIFDISENNPYYNNPYSEHVDWTLPASLTPIVAVYIMFPVYLNRFRVHVQEVTKYSGLV